jgi:hypothetical protein
MQEWEAALESLNWLHDPVTRSLVVVNDAKVLPDGSMQMGHGDAVLMECEACGTTAISMSSQER